MKRRERTLLNKWRNVIKICTDPLCPASAEEAALVFLGDIILNNADLSQRVWGIASDETSDSVADCKERWDRMHNIHDTMYVHRGRKTRCCASALIWCSAVLGWSVNSQGCSEKCILLLVLLLVTNVNVSRWKWMKLAVRFCVQRRLSSAVETPVAM